MQYQPYAPLSEQTFDEIGPAQRAQAESWLMGALLDGAVSVDDHDRRVREVREATTRAELDEACAGIAPRGFSREMAVAETDPVPMYTWASGAVHLSGLATGPVGPAVAMSRTRRGTWLHAQAARALNWQIYALIGLVLSVVILEGYPLALAMSAGFMAWLVLTLKGAWHAAKADGWRNPVSGRLPQLVRER